MTARPLTAGWDDARPGRGWFLALGVLQIGLGTAAVALAWVATLASVLVFGWLLILGGAFEVAAAARARRWAGVVLLLAGGVLSGVAGLLVVAHPAAAAAGLTLLLAAYFLAAGLVRVAAAIALPLRTAGWDALGGAVTAALGVLIWAEWPSSALWVIGTFVGIDLIFRGWAWAMLGTAARRPAGRPVEPSGLVAGA